MQTLKLSPRKNKRSRPRAERTADFEHIGDILSRLRLTRRDLEKRIRSKFNRELSLALDRALEAEEVGRER
jgi:hypothetical protein